MYKMLKKVLYITAHIVGFSIAAAAFGFVLYYISNGHVAEQLNTKMFEGLDYAIEYYDTNEDIILSTGNEIISHIVGWFNSVVDWVGGLFS